jgi:hypothetical protein
MGENGCNANTTGVGACTWGFRFGTDTNGVETWQGDGCCGSWAASDLNELLMVGGAYHLKITDFDVMKTGSIQ